jgi:hypothetical protein
MSFSSDGLVNVGLANNVNEIIVAFNQGNANASGIGGVNNVEDKKGEKSEKGEKSLKSSSKSNNKNSCEKSNDKRDDCSKDKKKVTQKREELTIKNYNKLLLVKYRIDELKTMCIKYKIPRTGNKDELTKRLYDYCKNSIGPIKIQKVFRGFLVRKLHKLQGLALKNRKICTNDTDFFTMDYMSEIETRQFFSYKDDDDFVYGFNIVSLYNLIIKEGSKAKNPYNRSEFNNIVKGNVTNMIRISKILKIPIEIDLKNEIVDPAKRMELKILELFQTINSYGNYANSEWFSELTRNSHIKFARELVDIWNYRALLTQEKKHEICPPHGTPFLGTPYFTNIANNNTLGNLSIETLVKYNVQIIENLVKSSIDLDNKMLGSLYVLSALTLVSQPARDAMPWLYDAVVYIP